MKIGTVGRPLPGHRGPGRRRRRAAVPRRPGVRRLLANDEAATAEALDADGWFHTGDLGEIDDEGFVRITGRKKEILVTAGGKNVAPAVLEDRMRAHPLVSQCMVVGDGGRSSPPWSRSTRDASPAGPGSTASPATLADLVDDPDLRAEVQAAVDEANRRSPRPRRSAGSRSSPTTGPRRAAS